MFPRRGERHERQSPYRCATVAERLACKRLSCGVGVAFTLLGLPLFILNRYGLGPDGALALALRYLPNVVAGPWMNYVLRRMNPRILAQVSTTIGALLVILIPFTNSILQLQMLSVFLGLVAAVDIPSRLALRPWVTAPGREMELNSKVVTIERVAITLGPLSAAGAAAALGIGHIFFVQAALVVPAALVLFLVRRPHAFVVGRSAVLREPNRLRWNHLRSRLDLTVVAYSVTALVYMVGVGSRAILLPLLAAGQSWLLGLFTAAFAIGGIAGGDRGDEASNQLAGPLPANQRD